MFTTFLKKTYQAVAKCAVEIYNAAKEAINWTGRTISAGASTTYHYLSEGTKRVVHGAVAVALYITGAVMYGSALVLGGLCAMLLIACTFVLPTVMKARAACTEMKQEAFNLGKAKEIKIEVVEERTEEQVLRS